MNTNDNICYTGIGAIEDGNHTKKEFLSVMDKTSKKKCSVYIKSLKCKSCKKSKKHNVFSLKIVNSFKKMKS